MKINHEVPDLKPSSFVLARNVPLDAAALESAVIDDHLGQDAPAFRKQPFAYATTLPTDS